MSSVDNHIVVHRIDDIRIEGLADECTPPVFADQNPLFGDVGGNGENGWATFSMRSSIGAITRTENRSLGGMIKISAPAYDHRIAMLADGADHLHQGVQVDAGMDILVLDDGRNKILNT